MWGLFQQKFDFFNKSDLINKAYIVESRFCKLDADKIKESASISFESPYMGTIGGYLIERLQSLGVDHVFGVLGDYIIAFFKQLSDSKIQLVTTCDELTAGYAADAYARIRGLGAICVTYCIGGLKVVNAAAQAFAESRPSLS